EFQQPRQPAAVPAVALVLDFQKPLQRKGLDPGGGATWGGDERFGSEQTAREVGRGLRPGADATGHRPGGFGKHRRLAAPDLELAWERVVHVSSFNPPPALRPEEKPSVPSTVAAI